jgi:hypothetical protein
LCQGVIVPLASQGPVMLRIRQVLADSHVAAVTIAVLLCWSLDSAFRGLWDPVYELSFFLFTAVAIRDIPYFSTTLTAADRAMLFVTCYFLYSSIISLSAAWLLSRWIYGIGPLRSLELAGRKYARAA